MLIITTILVLRMMFARCSAAQNRELRGIKMPALPPFHVYVYMFVCAHVSE